MPTPLITNDAVVLGLLCAILALVFWTERHPHRVFRAFYRYVPALLLCYFIPALFNTFNVIDGEHSRLYYVSSRYLLPATLILLTLSMDIPAILRLGPKALAMFLTGTLGVIVGGPLAILIWSLFSPETVGGDVWRGMTAIAGSWIGGGANQAAMKEVFEIPGNLFGTMVAVDVIVANIWMAFLLYLAGRWEELDKRRGVDVSALVDLRRRIEEFERQNARIPKLPDLVYIAAIGFGFTAVSHALATPLAAFFKAQGEWAVRISLTSEFFWIVVLATTFGLLLSLTRARRLEGAGASKVGSLMLYVLVASIGMHMNLRAIVTEPLLFGVGLTWILIHGALMLTVMHLIRAPIFYMAVGSQANIGGAASAPVVASAFHPALAPVGVLLAVLGYALGTYGAWVCGQFMRLAAPG
jgi:uncharacterized membrane protein